MTMGFEPGTLQRSKAYDRYINTIKINQIHLQNSTATFVHMHGKCH